METPLCFHCLIRSVTPGYAKQSITGATNLDELKLICTAAIYESLVARYCAVSDTPVQAQCSIELVAVDDVGHAHAHVERGDLVEVALGARLAEMAVVLSTRNGCTLDFDCANKAIRGQTYSPYLDQFLTDDTNQFTVSLDL